MKTLLNSTLRMPLVFLITVFTGCESGFISDPYFPPAVVIDYPTPNQQFPRNSTVNLRAIIAFHTDDQLLKAEGYIEKLNDSGLFRMQQDIRQSAPKADFTWKSQPLAQYGFYQHRYLGELTKRYTPDYFNTTKVQGSGTFYITPTENAYKTNDGTNYLTGSFDQVKYQQNKAGYLEFEVSNRNPYFVNSLVSFADKNPGKNSRSLFENMLSGFNDITLQEKQRIMDIAYQRAALVGTVKQVPSEFLLSQNYPNPFNPSTSISYSLPQKQNVKLTIYDMAGREIKTLINGLKDAGHHVVTWDGTGKNGQTLSSGVYIYRLTSDNYSQVKHMNLVK